MNPEAVAATQAAITELETKIAACDLEAANANAAAKKFNDVNRKARDDASTLREAIKPLKEKLAAHLNAENKRLKDEALAKMKAEAEAKAKEPKPKSEVELLREEMAALLAQLAKG